MFPLNVSIFAEKDGEVEHRDIFSEPKVVSGKIRGNYFLRIQLKLSQAVVLKGS